MISSQLSNLTIVARQPRLTNSLRSNLAVRSQQTEFYIRTISNLIMPTTQDTDIQILSYKRITTRRNYQNHKSSTRLLVGDVDRHKPNLFLLQ